MNNSVVVGRYTYPFEAQIARASLEHAGIPAFIADEQTIHMDWLMSDAMGGIRLHVAKEHEVEAIKILQTDFSDALNAELGIEEEACPRCGSTAIEPHAPGKVPAFVSFLLLGIPLFFKRSGYICKGCGLVTKAGN